MCEDRRVSYQQGANDKRATACAAIQTPRASPKNVFSLSFVFFLLKSLLASGRVIHNSHSLLTAEAPAAGKFLWNAFKALAARQPEQDWGFGEQRGDGEWSSLSLSNARSLFSPGPPRLPLLTRAQMRSCLEMQPISLWQLETETMWQRLSLSLAFMQCKHTLCYLVSDTQDSVEVQIHCKKVSTYFF